MNPTCSANRVIAAILLFFVLGLLLTSARSTSHEQVRHAHAASSAAHAADHDAGGDDAAGQAAHHGALLTHTHEHDPGDHTHDIPLRPTITLATMPPAPAAQATALTMPAPFHPLLLERPPRPLTA